MTFCMIYKKCTVIQSFLYAYGTATLKRIEFSHKSFKPFEGIFIFTDPIHVFMALHGKQMRKQWKQCEGVESESYCFRGAAKITADGDCSHEIKRRLLLGRTVMTNLDSILKNRDITLLTEVCLFKAMVFPVVMYGCESWTIKKAEC